ncbi:T9SS type A sorting domain-containing protein [Hymenobacter sp. HSC-4F20]|uniref:T9SS type A sorting domain-containing protein n=1 Tax=Hymenobacter sp. HSC-4F20 TaxID=2864135 RepID=UPI001C72EEAB|nr:T9SS type A sorting domain-containing protein [Hymenobacter sp. HSC-4F20]MBX0290894.1 T9SS type A sorting domain-containing protein [Hymenobacter sp. HSC-4F20]
MEKNNAYFEVQRSPDGKTFATIGRVAGRGTTAAGSIYSFTDLAPLPAQTYYRLRQVDTDGTEAFSSVEPVAGLELQENMAVYPNPSAGTITLPVGGSLLKYRIYSATGTTLATGEAQGGSTINVQQLPTGQYFVELTTPGGKRSVQRFVRK